MKKYLIALLFAFGLTSMHTASASALEPSIELDGGTTIDFNNQISGTFSKGFHLWELTLGEASNVTFNFGTAYFAFDTSPNIFQPTPSFTQSLLAGSYGFHLMSTSNDNKFSIITSAFTSAVPVPGAIWLFGSALAGLMGVTRRKSTSRIAVA